MVRSSGRRLHCRASRVWYAAIGRLLRSTILVVLPVMIQSVAGGLRSADAQTVRAVLFFSPTCQHCHQVITQYLPVLFESYGGLPSVTTDETVPEEERSVHLFHNGQLEILLVDASKPPGTALYQASTVNQGIPPERSGVPRLVIGDVWLVGSVDIPERTGELVRQGLDQGGLGWPSVDGLDEALASIPGVATAVAAVDEDSAAVDEDSATGAIEEPKDSAATEPEPGVAADTTRLAAVSPDSVSVSAEDSAAVVLEEAAPTAIVDTTVQIEVVEPLPAAVPDAPSEPEGIGQEAADVVQADSVEATANASDSIVTAQSGDSAPAAPSVFEVIQSHRPSMLENFRLDPVGNSFSVVVLLFMIVSIVVLWVKSHVLPKSWGLGFGIPLLALVGAFVASYLTYIEATGATAVCGPVGDCNTVNQSDYAKLFGVLPVGALGLMGYVAISLAWSTSRYASGRVSAWASLSLLAMTLGGTLFSVYLTFLEPFVIGATCAWCLTSSVVITVIMWLSAGSGRDAWVRIRSTGSRVG